MSGKRCKNEEETRVEDSAGEDRVEAEGFILALSTVPDLDFDIWSRKSLI